MAESSETSRKRGLVPEHDIFLSHSSQEKPFVEQLFHDFRRAGKHPFFYQDSDSLPKAEKFAKIILDAVEQCQMGVVVLSENYLTSKWPMLELSKFVESKVRLFPLFFKLSPSDLKQDIVELKWKPAWRDMGMDEEVVETWGKAVKALRISNGLEFAEYLYEFEYSLDIVNKICPLLTPTSKRSTDFIQGRHGSKHRIFLSHSGKQKPFVEQLFCDLKDARQHVFFDQDSDSFSKAERFAPNILEAAQQCQMGVVVLSEDYLTSIWPMLELSKFVESKKTINPALRLLPLFYTLKPADLDDKEVESKWKPKWRNIVRKDGTEEEVIKSWSEAVKALQASRSNGLEFEKYANSEYKYRKDVVLEICKKLPPILKWKIDYIQGYERLCKEASSMFKDYESRKYLGLYGMAGVGKSTLCKAMCNYCQGEFEFGADVYYVELENDKADDRLARLKEVLQQMLGDSLILNYLATEEQGWECLRMTLQEKPKIFLAIDNVGDSWSSKEEARLYLGVELPLNSMVLITSRSKGVLEDVLERHGLCKPIPRLRDDEALNLFLSTAVPEKSYLELNSKEMEIVKVCLTKCQFQERGYGSNTEYHPLVLKAIGTYLYDVGSNILSWSEELEGNNNLQRSKALYVNSVLGLAYGPLSNEMKLIFLDTALYPHYGYAPLPWWSLSEIAFEHESDAKLCLRRKEDAWSWVSWISEVHCVSLIDARMILKKLQRLALIQVSPSEEATQDLFHIDVVVHGYSYKRGPYCEEAFGEYNVLRMEKPLVHDLYKEFAKSLVEKEGSMEWKWWMSREELGKGEVPKLKRVVLEKDKTSIGHPPRKLQDWTSLTLLELIDCLGFGPNNVLDLGGLRNLRVLAVDNCRGLQRIVSSCNNGGNYKISPLTSVMLQGLVSLVNVSFLDHNLDIKTLRVLNCNESIYPTSCMNSGIMDLRILKKLHTLIVWDCLVEVDEANIDALIQWLHFTLRFQELSAFEYRVIEKRTNLGKKKKNSPTYTIDLHGGSDFMSKLLVLSLCLPRNIEIIQGLHTLSKLRILNLSGCEGLCEIPNLQGLTELKQICMQGCDRIKPGHRYNLRHHSSTHAPKRSNIGILDHFKKIPLNGHSIEAFLQIPSCGRNMKDFSYVEVEHDCHLPWVSPKLPK